MTPFSRQPTSWTQDSNLQVPKASLKADRVRYTEFQASILTCRLRRAGVVPRGAPVPN